MTSLLVEVPFRQLISLDHTGHTQLTWHPDNAEAVAHARATFERLKAEGHMAYKVDRNGENGEVLRAFDPEAEQTILAPATVGG